jgi:hypothetical protein
MRDGLEQNVRTCAALRKFSLEMHLESWEIRRTDMAQFNAGFFSSLDCLFSVFLDRILCQSPVPLVSNGEN